MRGVLLTQDASLVEPYLLTLHESRLTSEISGLRRALESYKSDTAAVDRLP